MGRGNRRRHLIRDVARILVVNRITAYCREVVYCGVTVGILSLLLLSISCDTSTPDGAVLFKKERCIYCHSFKGQGANIGPDLTDVTRRRDDTWLKDQIRNPRLHNPDSAMPPHEYLSKKEINSLIKYLHS